MNNQMLFMLGVLVALVVILVVVYMPSVETYTKATTFASSDQFLTVDKKGEIKLHPVVDVDTAIDSAAASILKDTAAADKKTDATLVAYAKEAKALYETKQNAAKTFQPKDDYVLRNKGYKMTADNDTLGMGKQDNWGEKYITYTGKNIKA